MNGAANVEKSTDLPAPGYAKWFGTTSTIKYCITISNTDVTWGYIHTMPRACSALLSASSSAPVPKFALSESISVAQ